MSKGLRIKQLREAKNLTQEELAKLLNTKRQTISKYEKEIVTNIPSDRIEDLAKVLGSTPEYIMGWEEPIEEQKKEEQKKPVTDDGLTESQKKLIEFAKGLSADQADKVLRLMQSIVAFDE